MKLYPMKTKPVVQDAPWGGKKIFRKYGYGDEKKQIGTCMLLSGGTRLVEGSFKDLTVNQIAARYPTEFSGRNLKMFPHALKLEEKQHPGQPKVHVARQGIGSEWMHYEMILVLDAEPGAGIYAGFRDTLSKASYEVLENDKELRKAMNFMTARPGDLFLIPAGLLHALGGGLLTLVLSMGADEQYKSAATEEPIPWENIRTDLRAIKFSDVPTQHPWGQKTDIRMEGYLRTRHVWFNGEATMDTGEETAALFIISGDGSITAGDETVSFQAGDTFVFAAENEEFTVEGKGEFCLFG